MKASDIVRSHRISIPPERWRSMKSRMSRGEIKQVISLAIEGFRIPPPMVELTAADAKSGFDALRRLDTRALLKRKIWYSRHDNYRLKPTSWVYINQNRRGTAASNYFHQSARWQSASKSHASPFEVWSNDRMRRRLMHALFTLKVQKVDVAILRSILQLHSYIAQQFPPAQAKAIYDYFGARRVLDFCAGWGDRFAAFNACASTRFYLGIDPNVSLLDGYQRQVECYGTGKGYRIIPKAAEDVDLGEYANSFDLCFTSPPYFSAEHYSDDSAQSFKRYATPDAWLREFLFAALKRAFDALKPGGHMVVNIADTKIDSAVVHLCDPMNEYLSKLGATFVNCWGLEMSARPNSPLTAERRGAFAEPIWVWRKP